MMKLDDVQKVLNAKSEGKPVTVDVEPVKHYRLVATIDGEKVTLDTAEKKADLNVSIKFLGQSFKK